MNKVLREVLFVMKDAAQEAPRIYFAPLIGAIRGIREEYRRINADREARIARFRREQESMLG